MNAELENGGASTNMMTQEAPKLPSSHKHTICTTTHGAIIAERNPETDFYTSSE